ncbi:hypothetical protein C8Q75DRAFT_37473 [Abortiporus biennis]|nr:hypothetical protein C8Q75DRAFT_37473 [Abortiporus biennis]
MHFIKHDHFQQHLVVCRYDIIIHAVPHLLVGVGNKNYRFISSDVSTADDADDTSEAAAAAEFDQFQSESEWNEGSGSCALRYLLTLVAWHTAARAVIKLSRIANRIGKLPEVFLVRLPEYSSDALDDVRTNSRAIVDSLKAEIVPEYVDRPKAKEIILQSIERRCEIPRIIRPFRVHPEAGLMALLMKAEVEPIYLGHERTYQSTTDFFSEAENCAIGVNKMCCRTCNLLGECMSNELSRTVRLPPTHGQVLPWDPPSFGIPDTILQTLAQNLRKEMILLATSDIQTMEIWEEDDEIIFEARCITRTPEE